MGGATNRRLNALGLQPGGELSAGTYVVALELWFLKAFPELTGDRLRTQRPL